MKEVLSKQSSPEDIRTYFESVLVLSKDGNEFPINLDDVWPLAYSRKDHAVRDLRGLFVENIDYISQTADNQLLPKNGERTRGGQNKIEYRLTQSCFEFFIARKVSSVFEVYRQVFHHTMTAAEIAGAQTIEQKMLFATSPEVVGNTVKEAIKHSNKPKQITATSVRAEFEFVKQVKGLLNLSDTSVAAMSNKIAERYDLAATIDYIPSSGKGQLLSATELLKRHHISLKTQDFNAKLVENGILSVMTRQTTKKGKKAEARFKMITEKGLVYGENQTNPNNPKETQPLWYDNTFSELLASVGIK